MFTKGLFRPNKLCVRLFFHDDCASQESTVCVRQKFWLQISLKRSPSSCLTLSLSLSPALCLAPTPSTLPHLASLFSPPPPGSTFQKIDWKSMTNFLLCCSSFYLCLSFSLLIIWINDRLVALFKTTTWLKLKSFSNYTACNLINGIPATTRWICLWA